MASAKNRSVPIDPIGTRESILQAIAAAEAPVPSKVLGSLPALPRKIPATQVAKLLMEDLASSSVFNWGTKSDPVFWHLDPETIARTRLLEIAGTAVLTSAEITNRAAKASPKLNSAFVARLRTALLNEGRLREVPAAPRSKSKRLLNPEYPEVLESELARFLASFGVTRPTDRVRRLLAAELPQSTPQAPPTNEENLIRDAAEKIFAAMNRIAFSPGATVTFYRLRQQPELSGIPKQIFDRAALLLQDERRALLSNHDHAAALPPEERERFVNDGLGKFYVSIYPYE